MTINEELFTVDQVASHLDLHPKTVRRYINEGRLKARRVGGQWRISRSDLEEFTGYSLSETREKELPPYGEPEATADVVASESPGEYKASPKIEVSAIVDVRVSGTDEAMRIANTVTAAMNSRGEGGPPARCDHIYYDTEKRARFLLFGTPKFVSTMLELLTALA